MKIFGYDVSGTRTDSDYLSIDFGDSSIKIARAHASGGSISVTMADREPIPGDAPYLEAAQEALLELVRRNGIGEGQEVAMALPTSAVIVRPLELPAMPEERLSRVIEYEAESHIPFPLEEVVLDYHVVRETEENIDTILVAIKREKLVSHIDVIEAADLSPGIIDVSTFSLYNLYRYLEDNHEGETSALVDLGHESTDIAIFDGETLQFARSTSIGGQDLTKAIERRLGVDAEEARRLKHEVGHVPLEKPEDVGTGMDALQELAAEREREGAGEEEEPSPPELGDSEEGLSLGAIGSPEEESESEELGSGEENPSEPPGLPGEEGPEESVESESQDAPDIPGPGAPAPPEQKGEGDEEVDLTIEGPGEPDASPEEPGPPAAPDESDESEEPDLVIEEPGEITDEEDEPDLGSESGPPQPPPDPTSDPDESVEEDTDLDLGEPYDPEQDARDSTDPVDPSKPEEDEEQGPELGEPYEPDEPESPPPPDPSSEEGSREEEVDSGDSSQAGQPEDDGPAGPPEPPPGTGEEDRETEEEEEDGDEDEEGPRLDLGAAATPEGPEGDDPERDEQAREVGLAIRTQVDSIINEMRHTFDFYQTQLGGGTLDNVIFTGGGARLRNLEAVVEEELGINVDSFDPVNRVDGMPEDDVISMLVSLGLQLRADPAQCGVTIDLIPDYILHRRDKAKQRQNLVAIATQAALLVLLLGGVFFINYYDKGQMLAESESELEAVRSIVNEVQQMEERNEALQTRKQTIEELESQRAEVLLLLEVLNSLPGDLRPRTHINSISYSFAENEESELDLDGVTGSFDDLTQFHNWFIEHWFVLERTSESQSRSTITVDGTERSVVQFSLSYRVSFLEEED